MKTENANIEFGEVKRVFTGVNADARKLGVCRTHLYRVLSGKRKGEALLARYRELKKQQG